MNWTLFYSGRPATRWQLTTSLKRNWIRIRSLNPPSSGFLEVALAQNISGIELYDIHTLKPRIESEVLYFPPVAVFEFPRLGFRQTGPDLPSWTIKIEVDTMPLSFAFASSSAVTSSSTVATTVTSSATQITILAANPERKGASICNNSTGNLLIDLIPATGSIDADTFGLKLPPQSYYELPFGYTGAIMGLWDAVNGSALVREFI